MSSSTAKPPYAGYRFPLSLRMVEEMLAARGIVVSHETVRQWGLKFGQTFANEIRRRLPRPGDEWHLDEGRDQDRRQEALAVAGGRPGRPRARRAGAKPAR